MPRNLKTEPCAQGSYSVEKDYVDDSKSWPKSKAKILTSLLTATTMNSKYCKPFAIPFAKDEMSRIDGTQGDSNMEQTGILVGNFEFNL